MNNQWGMQIAKSIFGKHTHVLLIWKTKTVIHVTVTVLKVIQPWAIHVRCMLLRQYRRKLDKNAWSFNGICFYTLPWARVTLGHAWWNGESWVHNPPVFRTPRIRLSISTFVLWFITASSDSWRHLKYNSWLLQNDFRKWWPSRVFSETTDWSEMKWNWCLLAAVVSLHMSEISQVNWI
jgi:hypothetical protein